MSLILRFWLTFEITVSQLSDCLPRTSEDLSAMVDAEVKCTIH